MKCPLPVLYLVLISSVAIAQGVEPQRPLSPIKTAASGALYKLALEYSDALDRCTRSGCQNIDEVMNFFSDDAVRITPGVGQEVGGKAIRASFLGRAARLQQVVELKSIDLWGDMIVCQLERRDNTFTRAEPTHNLRILLVKEGKIKQLIVVLDQEEQSRAHAGAKP